MVARLDYKSDSRMMRLIAATWFRGDGGVFLDHYWFTFGDVIYVPRAYDHDPDWGSEVWQSRLQTPIRHALVHVNQARRWSTWTYLIMMVGPAPFLGLFMVLSVVLSFVWPSVTSVALVALLGTVLSFPLSVGLAWGRWRLEREAYMVDIRAGWDVNLIIDMINSDTRTWPKRWMRDWFDGQMLREIMEARRAARRE